MVSKYIKMLNRTGINIRESCYDYDPHNYGYTFPQAQSFMQSNTAQQRMAWHQYINNISHARSLGFLFLIVNTACW